MAGAPVAELFCRSWLCCSGPLTVSSTLPDSFLPPPVQMAPWAPQSVVGGRTMVTSAPESGSTTICQRRLPGLSRRLAPVTSPSVTLRASWSRRVT